MGIDRLWLLGEDVVVVMVCFVGIGWFIGLWVLDCICFVLRWFEEEGFLWNKKNI